ncbi:hypothetical protein F4804DRAFT_313483 [Jackrogersella minutella]|nr:hypothetical protein F4804DRAFT_313483 [Jackrogersella minutella]
MPTDWNKLKVVDLKAELKRLGLPLYGLKADLVARLEAEENVSSPTPEQDTEEAHDVNGELQPHQASSDTLEATEPTYPDKPPQQAEGEPDATQALRDTPAPSITETQVAAAPSSSGATPLRTTELLQDSQKRKRRSLSPPPSIHEVARKRARQEDRDSQEIDVADPIVEVDEATPRKEEKEDVIPAPSDIEMHGVKDDAPNERDDSIAQVNLTQAHSNTQNGHPADIVMSNTHSTYEEPHEDKNSPEQHHTVYTADTERDVAPSIHPATSALYIKNFMRPLREYAVKDHLLDLATPVGAPVEENSIINFYLDNIRTHAFVVFNTISSAARVRTALHNRVWPDETNRKALWVDFMPPERFAEWVDMEQSSSGGRGLTSRYEVIYDTDEDGNVIVKLDEFDSTGPAPKQAPLAPEPQPERKMSIPTGPSRPFSGIEGAPTGPRGFQGGRGSMLQSSRMGRLDQPGTSTRAFPNITYQPVSEELAKRRLEVIAAAKTKDSDKEGGKDYKRYYFENGDTLVDRGPEIFLGIRPPHREHGRQRDQRREPARGRRGGAGGGGGRRRAGGMPLFHGVPRGGDRFRPGDSSASSANGRSRYADDRGNRRDGYSRYRDDRGSRRDGRY